MGEQIEKITMFPSYHEAISYLEDPALRLELYEAIHTFAFTGEEPEFSCGTCKAVFAGIRPNIEKSRQNVLNGGKSHGNCMPKKVKGAHSDSAEAAPAAITLSADSEVQADTVGIPNTYHENTPGIPKAYPEHTPSIPLAYPGHTNKDKEKEKDIGEGLEDPTPPFPPSPSAEEREGMCVGVCEGMQEPVSTWTEELDLVTYEGMDLDDISLPFDTPDDVFEDLIPDVPAEETSGGPTAEEVRARERRFDRFWDAYPKQVHREYALRAWVDIDPDDALTQTMLDTVEWQIQNDPRFRDMQFIPNPANWLERTEWNNRLQTDKLVQNRASPPAESFCKGGGYRTNRTSAPIVTDWDAVMAQMTHQTQEAAVT